MWDASLFFGRVLVECKMRCRLRNYVKLPPDIRVDLGQLFSAVYPVDICGSYASLLFRCCVFETRSLIGLPLDRAARAGGNLGSQRERLFVSG